MHEDARGSDAELNLFDSPSPPEPKASSSHHSEPGHVQTVTALTGYQLDS